MTASARRAAPARRAKQGPRRLGSSSAGSRWSHLPPSSEVLGRGRPFAIDAYPVPVSAALSPIELATGLMYGLCPEAEHGSHPGTGTPRQALDRILRVSLEHPPCFVAFSGGRDSSALLAAAVTVAKREDLDLPVPLTLEFASERTHEHGWQELVLRHLRLDDRLVVSLSDELDLVGPVSAEGLQRHGLLYPSNAHFVVPLAKTARGGSLLIGLGGDDIFGRWPWHDLGDLMARRRGPRIGDLKRMAHACSPLSLRAQILRRREPFHFPWIVEARRGEMAARVAREQASAPRTWAQRMLWSARWRTWRVTAESVALLGADHGAAVASPFLDPIYLASLARAGGRWGWGNRTETMRALFGDLLPDALLTRRGKAEFSGALFGPETVAFARSWDGRSGIDPTLIDGDGLRRAWLADYPPFPTSMILQAAWLARRSQAPRGIGASGGRPRTNLNPPNSWIG